MIRVLLCDDVADIRYLMRVALSAEPGFEVVGEAANGAEAVEQARELAPDVVLLDLNMPMMNGLEALPKIREASPQSKILVLSGFESQYVGARAIERGAHGYLEKGTSFVEIRDHVLALAKAS